MRIPAWLDPWWHTDFELNSGLTVDRATAALLTAKGRLRGRKSADGTIVLVRRGGFMNQLVRARATVDNMIRVRIARPATAVGFFVIAFVFVVGGTFLELVLSAMFDRTRVIQSAIYLVLGAVIWVSVIGANYTSARSEARELELLIRETLGV